MATQYLINGPTGIDKPIQAMQIILDAVDWLDMSYGKSFRLAKIMDNKIQYFPAVYTGSDMYKELVPDQYDGNSIFFIAGNQKLLNFAAYEANISAVVFVDLRDVDEATHRAVETAKKEIMDKLINTPSSSYTIVRDEIEIEDNFEDVYKEYSYKELSQLATMHPYAIFRINFTIHYRNNC